MFLITSLLLTLMTPQLVSDLELTPLALDAKKFRNSFNNASDAFRLVPVFSPT